MGNAASSKSDSSSKKSVSKADSHVTTVDAQQAEDTYKKQCRTASYEELARDEKGKEGEYFTFTGKVIQVDDKQYRMNVTKITNEYLDDAYYEDTIYFTYEYKGGDRILEDDIITIWGQSSGLYTYTSVLGQSITLPSIDVEYAEMCHDLQTSESASK